MLVTKMTTSQLLKSAELKPDVQLRPHQVEAVERTVDSPDGQLLVHGLGTGKTLSSIAAAEEIGKPAVVAVPAALRNNFSQSVERFTNSPKENYDVVSYDRVARDDTPTKPTFIGDEIQRLRNQGKAYKGAMRLARTADKRILLSGTPLVNSPGDLAAPINLMYGKQIFSPEEFEQKFSGMDIKHSLLSRIGLRTPKVVPSVKNKETLLGMLRGRVHYVEDVSDTKPRTQISDVPVEMGQTQDRLNRGLLGQLPFHLRWLVKHNLPPNKRQATSLNAFMGGMRQVGLSPYGFDKRLDPYEAFKQSPKMTSSFDAMQKHLAENPAHKGMVYSNFIDAGIRPYAAALERQGIPYVSFYGGMSDGARRAAIDSYNNGKSRVVLIGPAGSEGISLRGTTAVHMLDPHWHEARSNQAMGRAVRLDSHIGLPLADRNVAISRYISEPRKNAIQRLLGKQAIGSDRYLYTRAAEKQKTLDVFTDVLREASEGG